MARLQAAIEFHVFAPAVSLLLEAAWMFLVGFVFSEVFRGLYCGGHRCVAPWQLALHCVHTLLPYGILRVALQSLDRPGGTTAGAFGAGGAGGRLSAGVLLRLFDNFWQGGAPRAGEEGAAGWVRW